MYTPVHTVSFGGNYLTATAIPRITRQYAIERGHGDRSDVCFPSFEALTLRMLHSFALIGSDRSNENLGQLLDALVRFGGVSDTHQVVRDMEQHVSIYQIM